LQPQNQAKKTKWFLRARKKKKSKEQSTSGAPILIMKEGKEDQRKISFPVLSMHETAEMQETDSDSSDCDGSDSDADDEIEFAFADTSTICRGPFLWFNRLIKESEAYMDYISQAVDPGKMYDEISVLEPSYLFEDKNDPTIENVDKKTDKPKSLWFRVPGKTWSRNKAISSSNDTAYSEDESLRDTDSWSNASLDEEGHVFDLTFLYQRR
jgi:hypothetical protein